MKRFVSLLSIALLLCALPALASAQVSWDGRGGGVSWSDGANWSTGNVPTSSNIAEIMVDDTVEISTRQTVDSLNFDSGNARLEVQSGGELTTLLGARQGSGTITGEGTFTVQGKLTWDGGTVAGAGTTFANGGFAINRNVTLDGRRLILPTGQEGRYNTSNTTQALNGANGAVIEI